MSRLEILAAAAVLILVCLLSCAQSGYVDPAVTAEVTAESTPLAALMPLQRHSFYIAALAVTLLGLLLEDGRRRALR